METKKELNYDGGFNEMGYIRPALYDANIAYSFPKDSDVRYAFEHFKGHSQRILCRFDCEDGYLCEAMSLDRILHMETYMSSSKDEIREDGFSVPGDIVIYKRFAEPYYCVYRITLGSANTRRELKPLYNQFAKDDKGKTHKVVERREVLPITAFSVFIADKEQKQEYKARLEEESKKLGFKNLHERVKAYKIEMEDKERRINRTASYYKSKAYRSTICKFKEAVNGGAIRTSANTNYVGVLLGAISNRIGVEKHVEWVKYSSRESHTRDYFSYTLYVKRGYRIGMVGGLLTFWRGKFDRKGMACEWIEQGNGSKFNKFTTKKGYLVKGEHIEAKSLNEAVCINEKHRTKMLEDTLKRREQEKQRRIEAEKNRKEWERLHEEKIAEAEAYMDKVITFEDSLQSGNCRPGTQNFKDNVENTLGREVQTLTVREVLPLAIKFRQERYVQRIFNHKGWKVDVEDFK